MKTHAIYHLKNSFLLLSILTISLLCFWLINQEILKSPLYYDSFREEWSVHQIDAFINNQGYTWFSYLSLGAFNTLTYLILTIVLFSGVFFAGYTIKFRQLLKVVLVAELVLLIPLVIKVLWILVSPNIQTLAEVQQFYPLSLIALVDTSTINPLWIYPIQLINAFEILYCLLLAWGIQQYLPIKFTNSLKIVLGTYLPVLFLWIVFILFLSITFGPITS